MKPRYKWQPLRQSFVGAARREPIIVEAMQHYQCSRDEAVRKLDAYDALCTYWINEIYQVQRRDDGEIVHLNIRRRDGGPIMRDWRHFQQIKNELVGPECEGIELYPAESRLVDTSNKYHIYVVKDPAYRFPVGFEKRDVQYDECRETPGLRQRPL